MAVGKINNEVDVYAENGVTLVGRTRGPGGITAIALDPSGDTLALRRL